MASFRYIHAESQWWKTIDANTLFACEMIQVFPSRAFTVLQILHFYPSKAVYRKFSLQDICIEHIALLDFFFSFCIRGRGSDGGSVSASQPRHSCNSARHINKLWIYRSEESGSYHQRKEIVAICITRFAYQMTKSQTLASAWNTCYWHKHTQKQYRQQKDNLFEEIDIEKFFFLLLLHSLFCQATMNRDAVWLSLYWEKKLFHVGSTICGFQTDLLFLFDSFVGFEFVERTRVGRWQTNSLKTFIQINAHTLSIHTGESERVIEQRACNCSSSYEKKSD